MKRLSIYPYFFVCALLLGLAAFSQDTTRPLPPDYVRRLDQKLTAVDKRLAKKSAQYLAKFQKREQKLLDKLARKDSTKAAGLLTESMANYAQLQAKLKGETPLTEYLPSLDTLTTSLKFLSEPKALLASGKEATQQLAKASSRVKGLQSSLGKSELITAYLKERRQALTTQLKGLPFARDLAKLNKQAYYYNAQVGEYKQLLHDPKKREQKALALLRDNKAFQAFMKQHSQLAQLFRIPGTTDPTTDPSQALAGLQTRAQVTGLLQSRFGSDAAAVTQLRDNLQAAQAELSSLKSKAESLKRGAVGNTDGDMDQPDFRPNSQKTKSFVKRLELGSNFQSQRARYYFPVTTDLGLSVGYKLNDRSIIGIGGSYKLGLGRGWQHIRLTHQGASIRSFIDYQLKGGLYLSGGYEQNYRPRAAGSTISSPPGRPGGAAASGLLGLSKKYRAGGRLKGQVQLLWDFLSYQQVPRTQALLFRIGYAIK